MPTFTTHDPRYLDGEAHEVAELAGYSLSGALELSEEALEGFNWAARGAWLSSEEYRTGAMPKGEEFLDTAQGRRIIALQADLTRIQNDAHALAQAAAWNPRTA